MFATFLVLLVVYQLKHLLADYPLQTQWMLGKLKERGWAAPLAAHAGVHAAFTLVIALVVSHGWLGLSLILAAFDFAIHFAMDRIKASPKMLGRFKALSGEQYAMYKAQVASISAGNGWSAPNAEKMLRSNTYFWWALGLDQMVHHLTHYVIIVVLVAVQ